MLNEKEITVVIYTLATTISDSILKKNHLGVEIIQDAALQAPGIERKLDEEEETQVMDDPRIKKMIFGV